MVPMNAAASPLATSPRLLPPSFDAAALRLLCSHITRPLIGRLRTQDEVPRRREWPAGLTSREIDVLRLLALGLSSKQIAAELVISPKTARNHIEHIYARIDTSSRVGASLLATENGLL
jgi:DNA-binding NarL/FixJ family response regulator